MVHKALCDQILAQFPSVFPHFSFCLHNTTMWKYPLLLFVTLPPGLSFQADLLVPALLVFFQVSLDACSVQTLPSVTVYPEAGLLWPQSNCCAFQRIIYLSVAYQTMNLVKTRVNISPSVLSFQDQILCQHSVLSVNGVERRIK